MGSGEQDPELNDRPPPPVFSITPKRVFYIRGESIDITCSAPDQRSVSKIFLFKDAKQLSLISTSTFKVTLSLNPQDTGWYSCRYWVMESGQEIPAQETNSINVSVRDYLPSPVFSVMPNQNIYISGESINLTCSAPNKHYVSLSLFFKDWHLISTSHSLLTRRLSPQDGGRYSCSYIGVESGQQIRSWESNVLHVKVMDPPPAPLLEVDPPSGEVKEGDPLLITCLANGSNKERRFHFNKDGDEISSSSGGSLRSQGEPRDASPNSSVSIQQAKPSHNGEFTCSYEEEMDGRWISSPWSQKVNITVLVQGSSMQPLVYAWLAIPLLILTVALACYCWREKKKRASKQLQESHPQQNKQKAELDYLRTLATPTATLPPKDSDVTYAHLASCLPKAPTGPATEDGHNLEEEVSYSELLFTRINKASK
ncbi:B-cell receptor CD22-like isoform X2 [Hemicordylus capensis]|uniref:B-cell receptor CD22-like isoform X2 n=1 Tax=Hemicordylus capensis TaxID=884348 RepID=UPI0023031A22|nr:B-cell receptor CD22-like isoform X2 [Hemicordylus capensis]